MKRILSLFLVAALILAIPVMPVSAQPTTYENNITALTDLCPCGCGETLDNVDWMPWNPTIKGSPANGHHYLTADYVQESSAYSLMIIAGTKVVLDLRGFTWTTKSAFRTMTVQGDFYLLDTVGTGKFAPKTDTTWGGAVLVDTYETANPTFTLVSGTMTMAEGSTTNSGGMVYAREDGRFVMTGGVIENCAVTGSGGAVVTAGNATVEILGGIIRNCSAGQKGGAISSLQPVKLANCTFINCSAGTATGGAVSTTKTVEAKNVSFINCSAGTNGGAVYATGGMDAQNATFIGNRAGNGGGAISANGTYTLASCAFAGNDAAVNGGSIYTSGNITINNTTITGGTAGKWGGQIYLDDGTLVATGCTFNGGSSVWTDTVYGGGGNIFAYRGDTTLTNCTLTNGFATNYGGNLGLSASAIVTLNNTDISGGVCQRYGNNIGAQGTVTMTINGGNISGDVHLPSGSTTTLKGKLKIGLTNMGIQVGKDANVDASGLSEGSEIYISGTGNVVAAGANKAYFKGAIRTELSGGDGAAITGTAGSTGYCPHCLESVTWTAYNNEKTGGHFYLSESRGGISPTSGTTVIDLNGKTISSTTARAVTISTSGDPNIQVAILDSAGLGKVTGNGGTETVGGGVVINNGLMKIYGGTFKVTGAKSTFGGALYNRGTMEIYGGCFDGSTFNCTENSQSETLKNTEVKAGRGGTVYSLANKTLKIKAGHFIGGTAYNGGNLWIGAGTTTDITGGTFAGGTASNSGGNIFFAGTGNTGSAKLENAVFIGGSAVVNAGNIRPGRYGENTIANCYIADGKATGSGSYGGNLAANDSNVTITDSVIYGGTAYNGGNMYTATLSNAVTLDGCRVIGGTATNNGGNIMFNHGTNTISGGEISYGTARIGGNLYTNAGNHQDGGSNKTTVIKNQSNETPLFLAGTASYGANITVMGVLELTDARFACGNAKAEGRDIQMTAGSVKTQLIFGSGVTGDIRMIASSFIDTPVYGQPIADTVCTEMNANLVLETAAGMPSILTKNSQLYVSSAQLLDKKGNTTWYADYATAEAACAEGEYVKLFADTELKLTKDTFVDLNGHAVTVSGSGKLLGMDTTGDNYDLPKGKVTFEGVSPVADKSIVYAPNGNKYVALVEGNAVSFHRLGADLTTVTINIDKNGVYFKGKFAADEKLKGMIDTYGIAVSLEGMPTNNNLANTHKSQFNGADMANGQTASGVIITNILKDGLDAGVNAERGQKKIYASTYVALNDGATVLMGDQADTAEDDVAWSLYDAFTRLDALIDENPTVFRRHTNDMRNYYEKWQDKGIANWVGENSNFIEPEEDDVIDVLMIGSSSCYYYVEEMASLAAAAGIKLRVCNVYYSGCPIDKYLRDWQNNYADYQFFDTIAEEIDGEIVAIRRNRGGGKTLEWCLAQGDWDVITVICGQAINAYLAGEVYTERERIKTPTEVLLPYIRSQFPDADFYVQETKTSQSGRYDRFDNPDYPIMNLECQTLYTEILKEGAESLVAKFNAEPYNLDMMVMPDGEAWQYVREGFEKYDGTGTWEKYDDMCARIGFVYDEAPNGDPNQGDMGHDGDIGGGQYLNGAVWLQTIVMNMDEAVHGDPDFDVREITWVPVYKDSSGKVVEDRYNPQQMLEAAYKAAKEGWTPPANFASPVK